MEVDKHPPNSSQSFSGTAEDSMNTSIGKTTTPALSPEKSLFGNSADKLRESNLESIVSNGNTSSNGKETFEESNDNEKVADQMEVDISKNNVEEEDSKDDSLENKIENLLDDKKSDEKPVKDNKNITKYGEDKKEDEEIEDKANEELCIRREVTPLTDKEVERTVEMEKDVTPEDVEMDAKDDEEEAGETPAKEDIPEHEAPSTRRSTRRSNASAPKPVVTPKATPKNAKKGKATPVVKKNDSEKDKKDEEKEGKTAEVEETEKDENQTDTPSTRRNLRTPKSATKEVKTPASSSKSKKSESNEEAPVSEESATGGRRRSTRAAVVKKEEEVKTPAKTVKKEPGASTKNTRKRGVPKEEKADDEKEEEAISESETKTPAAKRAKKEEVSEEKEAKPSPRRASARAKAAAKTPTTKSPASKTPKGKATPKKIKQESEAEDVEMESEEEVEEEEQTEETEEKPTKAGQKTPKRAPPKRGSATGKRQTKAGNRKRNASEPSDPNDPFNFDAKKDEHPELFKSVHVERQSYGNIKFFKTQNAGSASKYASMEKNATERRSLIPETSPTSAVNTPGSSKTSRTPASTKKSPVRRGRISLKGITDHANANETVVFEDDGEKDGEEPKKLKTPKAETTAIPKPPKIQEEAPKLSPEEQVAADDESNAHFPKGARVYAIWGKEYYSAVCDDSDGLGRYKVFYTEDQSIRNIPRAGVIPLYMVKEGSDVSVLGEKDEDGERAIYGGKVLEIPSIKNTEEWHRGLYKIEVQNEEHPEPESREIEWFDIYFTEPQYKQIIKTIKNPTVVDAENVIESGRRTRRSTAAVTAASAATTTLSSTTTPSANPKPRGKPGPKPKGTPKATPTPKKVEKAKEASPEVKAEDTSKEEESGSETNKNPSKFFDKLQFILTSANRQTGPPPFTKKEVRKQIESRGGNVVETFESMNPELTTYLIADTFYRTHKYLTALSLSVPTVSFKWINKCVEENKLADYNDFMLDAGESETTKEVYKWKPLKGKILVGKKVAVYSRRGAPTTNNGIDFCQIWGPIVVNLGGELVKYPTETEKAVEFFKNKDATDYFIADDGTPQELINAVSEGSGIPVTSEWIIQTIITGILATTSGNESYILPTTN